ncbi:MAG: long-chain fatty acid transport protein [Chthoniobacter sp.]|nr:long-chain fatty acid transport protein [Chthoniobacter sp.]
MKSSRAALLLTCLLGLAPGASWGLGIRISDQNPEATARGNAFTATADNPSAVYYNPAGITQLEGTQTLLGAYAITLKTKVDLDAGDPHSFSSTNDGWQAAPQAFLTWKPKQYPIALGLGIYAPYGFALDYPDDTPFRTLAHKGSIEYLTVNPVFAAQISRSFSAAIGATINYGKAELERGVLAKGDQFRFEGDDVAYGFNAGLLWTPHRMHHFGVNYRSATTLDFDGDTHLQYDGFTVPTPFGPFPVPGVDQREDASAKFQFPQTIVVGYAFTPTPDWNFEVNIDWTDWDSLNVVTLRQKSGDVALPFNWESSFFYEFGVTKKFAYGLHGSAGYIYSENSVPNESFNPTIPDSNRHIFSVGVGQQFTHFNWDLAYQYAHGPSRTIDQGTAADGRYRFDSHAVTLSLGYHF